MFDCFSNQFEQYWILGHSWNRRLKISQPSQFLRQELGQIDVFVDLWYCQCRHRLHSSIIRTKSLNK